MNVYSLPPHTAESATDGCVEPISDDLASSGDYDQHARGNAEQPPIPSQNFDINEMANN